MTGSIERVPAVGSSPDNRDDGGAGFRMPTVGRGQGKAQSERAKRGPRQSDEAAESSAQRSGARHATCRPKAAARLRPARSLRAWGPTSGTGLVVLCPDNSPHHPAGQQEEQSQEVRDGSDNDGSGYRQQVAVVGASPHSRRVLRSHRFRLGDHGRYHPGCHTSSAERRSEVVRRTCCGCAPWVLAVMTPPRRPEIPQSLAQKIEGLETMEDVTGWREGVRIAARDYAPGEAALLADRERRLAREAKR